MVSKLKRYIRQILIYKNLAFLFIIFTATNSMAQSIFIESFSETQIQENRLNFTKEIYVSFFVYAPEGSVSTINASFGGIPVLSKNAYQDMSVQSASFRLNPASFSPGEHILSIWTIGSSNQNSRKDYIFTIPPRVPTPLPTRQPTAAPPAGSPPSISYTGFEAGQSASGRHTFTVTATDPYGLTSMQVSGFDRVLFNRSLPAGTMTHTEVFEVDTTTFPNGNYEIELRAQNTVNRVIIMNKILTISNSIVIEAKPPLIIIPSNTPGLGNPGINAEENTADNSSSDPKITITSSEEMLISSLSQIMTQLTEITRLLLKTSVPDSEKVKTAKAMASNLSELANLNKAHLESNSETKLLPDQTKKFKKNLNKALNQAKKKNDKKALKAAQKELNKANRQLKKAVMN